jgi:hypothetical protein
MNQSKILKNPKMKTIDCSEEVLEFVEDYLRIISITSIPYETKLFYYKDNVVVLAYDLMLDNWQWVELCEVTNNALFQLQTFHDIKELVVNQ